MPPEMPERRIVASSDGVGVVVHHLAPGPSGAPLLISHATGMHGRAYTPMAAALGGELDAWALDTRGHGSTPAPENWTVDWNRYGDDAEAAARWVTDRAGGGPGILVGFGHSLGGATLLMAAYRNPGLFKALVLFEPIVFPPFDDEYEPADNPMAIGALRRRRGFGSYDEAITNYASKPPMNRFTTEALAQYVYGGLAPVDAGDPDGPVELTCTPELESATFAMSRNTNVWKLLPAIDTPTLVIGGKPGLDNPPSLMAEPAAQQLPNGRYQGEPELDHFGPFVEPAKVAAIVRTMS